MGRAHLADIGFPTPTTYGPLARDVYEEGLDLPVRPHPTRGRDITEVNRHLQGNIRAPEQFYGDYLACLAAVRDRGKGCSRNSAQNTAWIRWRPFSTSTSNMPRTWRSRRSAGCRPAGWKRKRSMMRIGRPTRHSRARDPDVDPDAAMIEIGLRQTRQPCRSHHLTESTTTASCRNGVLSMLGPDVPRCTGAYRASTF